MWADFMLDDARMTNSTFNEGYDVSGALHYPAYEDDARISHAHGWSTGPLLALTNYAAGLRVTNSSVWEVYPQPGNLTNVEAGFTTAIGTFSAAYSNANGTLAYNFQTPPGTSGTFMMPGVSGSLRSSNGTTVQLANGVASNVAGGNWTLVVSGTSTSGNYTGGSGTATTTASASAYTGGSTKTTVSLLVVVAGLIAVLL